MNVIQKEKRFGEISQAASLMLLTLAAALTAIKSGLVTIMLWLAFPMMCLVANVVVYGGGWLVYRLLTL